MVSSVKRKAVTKLYNGSEAAKHEILPKVGLLNKATSLGANIPRLDIYVDISTNMELGLANAIIIPWDLSKSAKTVTVYVISTV